MDFIQTSHFNLEIPTEVPSARAKPIGSHNLFVLLIAPRKFEIEHFQVITEHQTYSAKKQKQTMTVKAISWTLGDAPPPRRAWTRL